MLCGVVLIHCSLEFLALAWAQSQSYLDARTHMGPMTSYQMVEVNAHQWVRRRIQSSRFLHMNFSSVSKTWAKQLACTCRNLTSCATRLTDSVNVVESKNKNIHILQPDQYIHFVLPSRQVFLFQLHISEGEFVFWLNLYKRGCAVPRGSVAGQVQFLLVVPSWQRVGWITQKWPKPSETACPDCFYLCLNREQEVRGHSFGDAL